MGNAEKRKRMGYCQFLVLCCEKEIFVTIETFGNGARQEILGRDNKRRPVRMTTLRMGMTGGSVAIEIPLSRQHERPRARQAPVRAGQMG